MNTLETLKALVSQLEAEQTQAKVAEGTPKPRCDAQGRLLEPMQEGSTYYSVYGYAVESHTFIPDSDDLGLLHTGKAFVSQPAAEAELTRLKCMQRLRGMEGYNLLGRLHLWIDGEFLAMNGGFNESESLQAAEATITPEERIAFLYRELMGEK